MEDTYKAGYNKSMKLVKISYINKEHKNAIRI